MDMPVCGVALFCYEVVCLSEEVLYGALLGLETSQHLTVISLELGGFLEA